MFSEKLKKFLVTDITFEVLANFIRQNSSYQKCFQIAHSCCGKPRYIEAEKVYSYEHNSKFKVSDETRDKLLHDIDEDEFYPQPISNRLVFDEVEKIFNNAAISINSDTTIDTLRNQLNHCCFNVEEVMKELLDFCRIAPRLPSGIKKQLEPQPIPIDGLSSREEIMESLESLRSTNPVVDLAFTAYRDMSKAPWKPFVKAAMERNPVSILESKDSTISDSANRLKSMDNESIYDGKRMAQPDEVWNFSRGDGLEKALCLTNIIKNRFPQDNCVLEGDKEKIIVRHGKDEYAFTSKKGLELPVDKDFGF